MKAAAIGNTVNAIQQQAALTAWRCRDRCVALTAGPLIMGILNVTPDSFSDGGETVSVETAVDRAAMMVENGADIIDVGGESSRPGALPVEAEEECARIIPVIQRLAKTMDAVISVDTRKSVVARRALDAGAHIVNDITAMTGDATMVSLVAESGAGLVLMHMQGNPQTMQCDPRYTDVVAEVGAYLRDRAEAAVAAGIAPDRIMVDPGIGFGKTLDHNLDLLTHLEDLRVEAGGFPVLIGLSRKRFLGTLIGDRPPGDRLAAGLAATAIALWQGGAVIRVHDVAAVRDVVRVVVAMKAQAEGA